MTVVQTCALPISLVSISKWEAKWKRPFLTKGPSTLVEITDYIRCMTLTENVDITAYENLNNSIIEEVADYIASPMTATWFAKDSNNQTKNKEVVTSELIYYWMIELRIPSEYQYWHFNRLITLIQVCNVKNTPAKKMSKKEILARNQSINDARRAATGSKG